MTVKDLIELLMKHDLDTKVMLDAYDGNGYNPITEVNVIELVKHRNPDSYGAGEFDDRLNEAEYEKALCIRNWR